MPMGPVGFGTTGGAGLGESSTLSTLGPYALAATVALPFLSKVTSSLPQIGGKSKDQQGRDQTREALVKSGIYGPDYHYTMTDGTKVNMGLDGSVKNYNLSAEDLANPTIGKYIALLAPLGAIAASGDKKRSSDIVGEWTNMVKGAKDPMAEIKALYQKANIFKEDALAAMDKIKDIDDQTRNVYKSSIEELGLPSRGEGGANGAPAPSGGGGGPSFTTQQTQLSFKMPKTDYAAATRSTLLNKLLTENSQSIKYPEPSVETPAGFAPVDLTKTGGIPTAPAQGSSPTSFNSTMNKIIGG